MESYLRKRGVRVALLVGVCLAAFLSIYLLRDIFAPLILGFLIAYVLDPLADALERVRIARWRVNRFAAVVVIFGVAAAITLTAAVTGGYYATKQITSFYDSVVGERLYADRADAVNAAASRNLPVLEDPETGEYYVDANQDDKRRLGYIAKAKRGLRDLREQHGDHFAAVEKFIEDQEKDPAALFNPDNLRKRGLNAVRSFWTRPAAEASEEQGGAGLFGFISYLVLCPLYVFFFLLQIDEILAQIRRYLPGAYRPTIVRLFSQIDRILSAFFRGRLMVCLVKGGVTGIGLMLLGVPWGFTLGLLAGFFALIPYVGIYFSLIPAVILSWVDAGETWRLIGIGGVFFIMEAVEGLVLIPAFLGKEVGLSPLTIIVTLLIFGKILGFVGVLLSVPLAAISKILGQEFLLPLVQEFADEPEPEPPSDAPAG